MENPIRRRHVLVQNVPAELAIRSAIDAVELLPANEKLTDAICLLVKALEAVADFVDKDID